MKHFALPLSWLLTRILLQIEIETSLPAIERGAVVLLGARRFLPRERRHGRAKRACAARTRRSGAAGGFSKSASTRKEISLRKLDPFGLGNIRFSLRQHIAENVTGESEPLERRRAGQHRLSSGRSLQFDAAVGGVGAGMEPPRFGLSLLYTE